MTEPDASPKAAPRQSPRYLLHAGLFLATFITTSAMGALTAHQFVQIPPISDGLSYSVPLLLILVCHEFGHFFAAKAHGVEASLPFFIPFPFGLGTLGAVIGMRNVTQDRRKLIDIGAAGPLAGLFVAIPVILYGLSLSPVTPVVANSLQEGNSLLYAVLKYLSKGLWLPGHGQDVNLHPTAWAGWAGLLVTMINLMPIGQLDGGHIATAYFGNNYTRFARRLHRSLPLVAVGVFAYVLWLVRGEAGSHWDWWVGANVAFGAATPWLIWFAIVAVVGRVSGGADHPTVEDEPLPRSRRLLFWVVVLVFVAIFMPVPYRGTMVGGAQPPPGAAASPPPPPAAPPAAP